MKTAIQSKTVPISAPAATGKAWMGRVSEAAHALSETATVRDSNREN